MVHPQGSPHGEKESRIRAAERWRSAIEAEHDQSDRIRGSAPPDDHWQPYSHNFRADLQHGADPLLDRLSREVMPHQTIIDVGAGAGRLALPLALRCQHVVAVEPSPSMASAFLQQAEELDVHNISLVQARWEEAEVAPGDIVLCVHVLYTIRDIESYVRKLEAHARKCVLIVLFKAPPQSQIYPLWKIVHEEERLPLPGLPQFEEVLREMGINAQLEVLPPQAPRGFDGLQQAIEQLSRRLYLAPSSHKRGLLERMLPDLLEEVDGVFRIRGAEPLKPALVWW